MKFGSDRVIHPLIDSCKGIRHLFPVHMVTLFLLITGNTLFGQDTVMNRKIDSLKGGRGSQISDLRAFFQGGVKKKQTEYLSEKISVKQDQIFRNLGFQISEAKDLLKKDYDSLSVSKEFEKIKNWYQVAADGVFTNKGTSQTNRNLAITNIILIEAQKKLDLKFTYLSQSLDALIAKRNSIDSLLADSSLLALPEDSIALLQFFKKNAETAKKGAVVYQELNLAVGLHQNLVLQSQLIKSTLTSRLEDIEQYRKNLSSKAMEKEFSPIWESATGDRSLAEIIQVSVAKNKIVMGFYVRNHSEIIILMFLLMLALAYYLRFLRKAAIENEVAMDSLHTYAALHYPIWVAAFVTINICQFFFQKPPFLFYAILWIIDAVLLSFLFWNNIHRSWKKPWLGLLFFFFSAILLNCVLQASMPERWIMLLLALSVLIFAVVLLKRAGKKEMVNRWMYVFIAIVILLEMVSVIANIFGRYNLAKTALTSGVLNLMVLVLLWWACYFINQIIELTGRIFKLGKYKEVPTSALNTIQGLDNFPPFLWAILFTGWFMMFMRNFYAFTVFTEPFWDFLEKARTVGKYSFSIASLFNFFFIMFMAMLLSKIVSFFTSDIYSREATSKKGIGSWLLLVRIMIFSLGLFLAFAASGIPMDKLAIIFSALSVGIGFGLQTLVNNLVSGLIIAFEKPINVGDIVDINGQSGTMKSIGFRSSVLATWDGSNVIIPNGDLLNAHLINWTLNDSKRRIEVLVGVAYQTDLEKIKLLLNDVVKEDKRVLTYPAPEILVNDFGNHSLNCRVLFWIDASKNSWLTVKSDLIQSIDTCFRKEAIEIPFPQQDIHIRTINELPSKGKEG